jgi:hypothetical protein
VQVDAVIATEVSVSVADRLAALTMTPSPS